MPIFVRWVETQSEEAWGSICSGTESPILVLRAFREVMEADYGAKYKFSHIWSCESNLEKLHFGIQIMEPQQSCRHSSDLDKKAPYCYVAEGKVSLRPARKVITGFPCVDFSKNSMNRNKKCLKKGKRSGQSGRTFGDIMRFAKRHQKEIRGMILENVCDLLEAYTIKKNESLAAKLKKKALQNKNKGKAAKAKAGAKAKAKDRAQKLEGNYVIDVPDGSAGSAEGASKKVKMSGKFLQEFLQTHADDVARFVDAAPKRKALKAQPLEEQASEERAERHPPKAVTKARAKAKTKAKANPVEPQHRALEEPVTKAPKAKAKAKTKAKANPVEPQHRALEEPVTKAPKAKAKANPRRPLDDVIEAFAAFDFFLHHWTVISLNTQQRRKRCWMYCFGKKVLEEIGMPEEEAHRLLDMFMALVSKEMPAVMPADVWFDESEPIVVNHLDKLRRAADEETLSDDEQLLEEVRSENVDRCSWAEECAPVSALESKKGEEWKSRHQQAFVAKFGEGAYPVKEKKLQYAQMFPGLLQLSQREWEVVVYYGGHLQTDQEVSVDVMRQLHMTKPSSEVSFRTITDSARFFHLGKKRLAFGMEKLFGQGVFYGPRGSDVETRVMDYGNKLLGSFAGNSFDTQHATRVICASFVFESLVEHCALTGAPWAQFMMRGDEVSPVCELRARTIQSLLFADSDDDGAKVEQ